MYEIKFLDGTTKEFETLEGINLTGADLEGADLDGADLEGADLKGADLEGASLRGTNLKCANLEDASLRGTNLKCANLEDADLENADLDGADLQGATLRRANLTGVALWDVVGNNEEIKTLQFPGYSVVFCGDRIQIGCKNYSVQEWESFDDGTIEDMEYGRSLPWWRRYKKLILELHTEFSKENK